MFVFTPQSEDAVLEQLAQVGDSPKDNGTLEMIVCRPQPRERQVLEQADISLEDGLIGDCWRARGSKDTPDGSAEIDAQITLINSRFINAIAQDRANWGLAGDQLYVDFDLSEENLPAGTRLAIGTVILEVTVLPHTGCKAFTMHFGSGATRLVNSPEGRKLRRRGVNTRVIQVGTVQVGDTVSKNEAT
jgi:hypothetical protein